MDLSTFTDAELDALRVAVLAERERRDIEATYPAQIEALSARYRKATGRDAPPVEAAQRGVDKAAAASGKP